MAAPNPIVADPVRSASASILVVDDEWKIRDALSRGMRKVEGWHVETASNGVQAAELASRSNFDVMVIDWMLPDEEGIEFLRRRRAQGCSASVLMLTARSDLADRVVGIEAGADDYLVKPFAFEELLARCRAMLRRRRHETILRLPNSDLTLDRRSRVARRGDREEQLTPLEADLLEYLMERADTVVTRERIARDVWRRSVDSETSNSINVHMARLRRKLDTGEAPPLIYTLFGQGYVCGTRLHT
jgi:DNA-binding response OmpR family regulator